MPDIRVYQTNSIEIHTLEEKIVGQWTCRLTHTTRRDPRSSWPTLAYCVYAGRNNDEGYTEDYMERFATKEEAEVAYRTIAKHLFLALALK